ncbi:uncharacterized protein LOC120272505 [Dioscorea cayenensis subsp. rotundata]|uniref:Uncharacterized protein LOC120272505 n=1 Tax=Dioscorea cayennensis subsp. rotundata TaxID=55577 RepID=A0AB40C640_DIOCR|nr:uncharacterized protein LOC120272505 [Dioscorea cayenensis subsp. rotundata]
MASKNSMFLALVLVLSATLTMAKDIECENMEVSKCAFSVSSTGFRCVLEKRLALRGRLEVQTCRTSTIKAESFKGFVETDECIVGCGLDRTSFGISTDALLEPHFTDKLCSNQCYNGCPNIIDLYFNLAAGEGVFLPKMCEVRQGRARREMVELRSGGGKLVAAAAVPESMESHASSPQSSVVFLGLGPVQPPL